MNKKRLALLLSLLLVVALAAAGCGTAAAPAAPQQAASASPDLAAKVDALQKAMDDQTKHINPGLGSIMIEYDTRFAKAWYSAEANNWDQAQYQLNEMPEVQEAGEYTRPKYATALKGFEKGYLTPLTDAVKKKDKAGFEAAYDKAIQGCNACHVGNGGGGMDSMKSIKITRPTASPTVNVDYAGN